MNGKSLYVISLVLLLSLIVIGLPVLIKMGTFQAGFEGAKCYFYGADFRFPDGWEGTNEIYRYQDAEDPLAIKRGVYVPLTDKTYWGTVATPNDAGIGWWRKPSYASLDIEKPMLGVHVESNIQLEDITRQGDPLHWNDTAPQTERRIEYWTKKAVKVEETDEKVVYQYTYEKESFVLAPTEFWIGFYLVPSQKDAVTNSGWREGEYSNIVVWFMLDWNVWDNAYKDPWLDDPEENVFDSLYEGQVKNREQTYYYRGGFPIAGWIQGWEKAGWSKMAWETGAINNPTAESPNWLQTRGSENVIYTPEELADLKDILMSKVEFAPSLIGQFISLYDEPSSKFEYQTPASTYESLAFTDDDALIPYLKAPDSKMKRVMYFPINIQNFGTYTEGHLWSGYRVFYPSAYFRIRLIYGVYGNFTYLWTEEVTKSVEEGGLEYPDEIERHGTTVIHTTSAWADFWGNIVGNPLFWFWLSLFGGIILIVVVFIILGPSALTLLTGRLRKKT